ncbi:hypothetical protein FBFR_13955 [Flavobacterium fryxellicola]|uniref:Uncharacterized protein n=1 Tax=Flavobacterium fryxellicola TaxID=249352 RepID=A0A167UY73_9FLAO|nr:hypothetical protein FBFR_13955 [Flavobacterium fryxellicola]
MQDQHKDYLRDFKDQKQKSHAKQWLVFPENIEKQSSIDETSLSNGELYTIVTQKLVKAERELQ